LLVFAAVCRSLKEPQDYQRITREYAQTAIAHNVMYAEIFISPSVWLFFHPQLDVRLCVEAIREVLEHVRAECGLSVKLICDLTRNFGAETASRTVALAASLQDLGVIAVGLGGEELRYPASSFADAFSLARKKGLHAVAHAGEMEGARSVRAAVEVLKAERIGHGVRALEDADVVDLLVRKRVPLEVCPTSNYFTGAVPSGMAHPLLELDRRGVTIALDTDDPAMFKTDLEREYAFVAACAGMQTAIRFARNGIDASFAPDSTKQAMHERLNRYCAEVPPAQRMP
jgi:adenosine deaminase